MPVAFTKKFSEENVGGQIRFSFYCDICRKEHVAPAVEAPKEQGLFQKWKSLKAYDAAFEAAQQEAKGHFNYCPICKRWVCDECLKILPSGDICKECMEITENMDGPNISKNSKQI